MATLIPILDLRPQDVHDAIRAALRSGLNADTLADFVASVDWSGTHTTRPPIADLVGHVEGWSAEYADGHLTETQYVGQLLSLLPVSERRDRVVLGGGPIVITPPAVRQEARPVPTVQGRSDLPPQTGSGAPPETVSDESGSGIALIV